MGEVAKLVVVTDDGSKASGETKLCSLGKVWVCTEVSELAVDPL